MDPSREEGKVSSDAASLCRAAQPSTEQASAQCVRWLSFCSLCLSAGRARRAGFAGRPPGCPSCHTQNRAPHAGGAQ